MLATLAELLEDAEKENKAVGSFSVSNMEIAIGTIKAAEDMGTPIIIQMAEGRAAHTPLNFIGPLMVQAAKDSSVRICVHLDHGLTERAAREVLGYGFTSVMFDGSRLPFEENIRRTNEIASVVRRARASLEAELGTIGGKEAVDCEETIRCTDAAEAAEFASRCDFDALAVAIGNAHGHYRGEPKLNFERLKEIHRVVGKPLVLHGGSGISDEDFRRCIHNGIRKINIATASLDALTGAAKAYFETDSAYYNFYDLNAAMRAGVYETVKHYIKVFNNKEPL